MMTTVIELLQTVIRVIDDDTVLNCSNRVIDDDTV